MKSESRALLYYAPIIVVAICAAYYFGWIPYGCEDYEHAQILGIDFKGAHPSYTDAYRHLAVMWHYDSFRLANIVVAILMLLPHWITGAVAGICVGLFLWLIGKLFGWSPAENWRSMAFATLGVTVLPAWCVMFPNLSYNVGYLYTLPFATWIILIFVKKERLKWWLALFLGFTLGWWHEGFSAPVLVGSALVMALMPEYRTGTAKWMLAGLLLGLLILYINPGRLMRMNWLEQFINREIVVFESAMVLLPCILFWVISVLDHKKGFFVWRSPVWIMVSTIFVLGVGMQLYSAVSRASFFCQMISGPALVWIFGLVLTQQANRSLTVGATAALLLITFSWSATAVEAYHEGAFMRRFEQKFLSDDRSSEFFPVTDNARKPWWLFGRTQNTHYERCTLPAYYHRDLDNIYLYPLIPADFASFDPESHEWIEESPGVWVNDGLVVIKDPRLPENKWRRFRLFFDTSLFNDICVGVGALPFKGPDGTTYHALARFVQPDWHIKEYNFRIKDINNLP